MGHTPEPPKIWYVHSKIKYSATTIESQRTVYRTHCEFGPPNHASATIYSNLLLILNKSYISYVSTCP